MSEANLVTRGHKRLRKRGAWLVKTTGVSLAGCPDTLLIYRGIGAAIEWKQPPNKPTRHQLYQLDQIRNAGGFATTATHPDDADRLLDEIDRALDQHHQEHSCPTPIQPPASPSSRRP